MDRWNRYWNSDPRLSSADALNQVGKTVEGKTISTTQFEAIGRDICSKLRLSAHDQVLDLCCGNGLVTHYVSHNCDRIFGIDFSKPLIEVARTQFNATNIEYLEADVRALPQAIHERSFTKIYMYEALQYLNAGDLGAVLLQISQLPGPRALLYLASIPDAARLWNFYDTPSRRQEYERRHREGNEAVGFWWERVELGRVLAAHHYAIDFMDQDPIMHGSHYRFDALCEPITA